MKFDFFILTGLIEFHRIILGALLISPRQQKEMMSPFFFSWILALHNVNCCKVEFTRNERARRGVQGEIVLKPQCVQLFKVELENLEEEGPQVVVVFNLCRQSLVL